MRYLNVLLRVGSEYLGSSAHHFEYVELRKLEMIASPGIPLRYVYFPEESLASIASHIDERRDVELGLIGREGMTGEAIVMGDDRSPFAIRTQMAGTAWRIRADHLRDCLRESAELHLLLLRYVRAQHLQLASTAASNARGTVLERLARWLLMVVDRIDGNRFHSTHDALAYLLATRRASVTDAVHILEEKGALKSTRNTVTILDRATLHEVAGASYGLAEREYYRLIGADYRKATSTVGCGISPAVFVEDVPHDRG